MTLLKRLMPTFVHTAYMIWNTFGYDCQRVLKHCFNYSKSEAGLKSSLIMTIHTIEKGLTMPAFRCGFGADKLKQILHLVSALSAYEQNSYELRYASAIVTEYEQTHQRLHYELPSDIKATLSSIKQALPPP